MRQTDNIFERLTLHYSPPNVCVFSHDLHVQPEADTASWPKEHYKTVTQTSGPLVSRRQDKPKTQDSGGTLSQRVSTVPSLRWERASLYHTNARVRKQIGNKVLLSPWKQLWDAEDPAQGGSYTWEFRRAQSRRPASFPRWAEQSTKTHIFCVQIKKGLQAPLRALEHPGSCVSLAWTLGMEIASNDSNASKSPPRATRQVSSKLKKKLGSFPLWFSHQHPCWTQW